jgi:hypothetical protein
MKFTKPAVLFFLIFISTFLFSQDTLTPLRTLQNLKRGIYFTYDEFAKNIPSISDSFTVIKDLKISTYEDGTSDSTFNGYTFKFFDSTKKVKKVFGFFDGERFFIDPKRGIVLRTKKHFTPVDYIGKYPFIELNSKKPITLLTLGWGVLVDDIISKKKKVLLYINKDGELSEATPASIWFFLKKDKDFLKEYDLEKKANIEVYKKYLIKMNEKYSPFN